MPNAVNEPNQDDQANPIYKVEADTVGQRHSLKFTVFQLHQEVVMPFRLHLVKRT